MAARCFEVCLNPCFLCAAWFAGAHPRLAGLEFVHHPELRNVLSHHDPSRLTTAAAGCVHLQLHVLVSHLEVIAGSNADGNRAQERAERDIADHLLQQASAPPLLPGLAIVRQVRSNL